MLKKNSEAVIIEQIIQYCKFTISYRESSNRNTSVPRQKFALPCVPQSEKVWEPLFRLTCRNHSNTFEYQRFNCLKWFTIRRKWSCLSFLASTGKNTQFCSGICYRSMFLESRVLAEYHRLFLRSKLSHVQVIFRTLPVCLESVHRF